MISFHQKKLLQMTKNIFTSIWDKEENRWLQKTRSIRKTTMICVSNDCQNFIHGEMLRENKKVDNDAYTAHLHRVNEALKQRKNQIDKTRSCLLTFMPDHAWRRWFKSVYTLIKGPFALIMFPRLIRLFWSLTNNKFVIIHLKEKD